MRRPALDMNSRAMRLYRCRNIPQLFDTGETTSWGSSIDLQAKLAALPAHEKYELAQQHLLHRKAAVEQQLVAYQRWAEIEAKPKHEQTPGEEHYCLCMEEWEKRFQPLVPSHDYDCDAGIMLFDMNMSYHNEAAQALMRLEEQRRLRQRKYLENTVASALSPGTATLPVMTAQPPAWVSGATATSPAAAAPTRTAPPSRAERNKKRVSRPTGTEKEDMFDGGAAKRQKASSRAGKECPESGAQKIVSNASL